MLRSQLLRGRIANKYPSHDILAGPEVCFLINLMSLLTRLFIFFVKLSSAFGTRMLPRRDCSSQEGLSGKDDLREACYSYPPLRLRFSELVIRVGNSSLLRHYCYLETVAQCTSKGTVRPGCWARVLRVEIYMARPRLTIAHWTTSNMVARWNVRTASL